MTFRKTIIGSLPKYNSEIGLAIKSAIDLQLKYDLQVVSTGEQRANMLKYFEQIPGLGSGDKGFEIQGKIQPMNDPSEFVKIEELELARQYLRRIGREDVMLKMTVTAPVTLGYIGALRSHEPYSSITDERLYLDLAEALIPIAQEFVKRGAMVQIDEPGLSAAYLPASDTIRYVNIILKGLPESALTNSMATVHMCGKLTEEQYREALKLSNHVLSLAFSTRNEAENISLLSGKEIHEHNKKIGIGCISPAAKKLEDVDSPGNVARRLMEVVKRIEMENVYYIHPDCGLMTTPKEATEGILKSMMDADQLYD